MCRAYHHFKQAEECRRYAEQAKRDDDRESWLRLAEKWQRIAEESDPISEEAQQPQTAEKKFSAENEGFRFDSNSNGLAGYTIHRCGLLRYCSHFQASRRDAAAALPSDQAMTTASPLAGERPSRCLRFPKPLLPSLLSSRIPRAVQPIKISHIVEDRECRC